MSLGEFRRTLKVAKQADLVMLFSRAFRKVAAATTNELSPAFTCVRTTVNKLLFTERNALAGLYGHTRSDRYFGASPCTAL